MFNRTIYAPRHESKVVAITKEIEKTISPDKVTEMYDAIEEELRAKIVRAISVESNSLNGSAVEFEDRYDTRSRHIVLRFTLNGREHISQKKIVTSEELLSEEGLYDNLRNFYEQEVSAEVMRGTVGRVIHKI